MKLSVLITTSCRRIELLFSRSLPSVLSQTLQPDLILIVDDNDKDTFNEIEKRLASLDLHIVHIPNTRTSGMSGTGAWNTGVLYLKERVGCESYVAILDDDDSWDSRYLESVSKEIRHNNEASAVFAYLKRTDCESVSEFTKNDLTIQNFLIGNPGIQGSNMVFRISSLCEIGGFDETLHSCTDRDLMIRFIEKFGSQSVRIIPHKLVNHIAGEETLTYDYKKKELGLDTFYSKHLQKFDTDTLNKSLQRSVSLFKYQNSDYVLEKFSHLSSNLHDINSSPYSKEAIAIGVAMHNNSDTIARCLSSIFSQRGVKRRVHIVVGNDASTDEWENELAKYAQTEKVKITILALNNNNVSKTRNAINDYIRQNITNAVLTGRLDSDDWYADATVLSQIEKRFDEGNYDVIIASNNQYKDGIPNGFTNYATPKLLDFCYLQNRVEGMAKGNFTCELPSCNIFVKPDVVMPYPDMPSGEDHFFLVEYLLNPEKLKICCAEDIVLTNYSLEGNTTKASKEQKQYALCRELLFNKIKEYGEAKDRIEFAFNLLKSSGFDSLKYLGTGRQGVVFTDYKYVYKIIQSDAKSKQDIINSASYFLNIEDNLSFYRADDIIDADNAIVIKYKYKESEPCAAYSKRTALPYLPTCGDADLSLKM